MSYKALDESGVIEYIKSRSALKQVFSDNTKFSVEEVGDGNLNMVFIVRNSDKPSEKVILKQALTYLRVAGESWPLTRDRMRFEIQALLKHNDLCPGLVPKVIDHDVEMSLVIMEFLEDHEVMRKPLVAGKQFPNFVDQITTYLVNSLFFTSDLYLSGIEKKELQLKCINPHLCKLQEDFVYTNPYMESEENNWNPLLNTEVEAIRNNGELKVAIAEMKNDYVNNSQAMIHGDLHTGSIMVNETDTRVFDPEFSFMGPMAYDVAALIQNLILNYLSHFAHTQDREQREDYQSYILETVTNIWLEFARKFDETWLKNNQGELAPEKYWDFPEGDKAFAQFRQKYLAKLLKDVAGHGGTKFLRRMMGIVSVADIDSIEDEILKSKIEAAALRIGQRWLLEKETISNIQDLTNIVTEEAAKIKI
ncbi:MAG: S-methyl-5-thioribose kinase [Lentisphaeraceae bacterium]|nr:S-methyl-5-thioribose kinase [Lentisphaeraceae bacterium]